LLRADPSDSRFVSEHFIVGVASVWNKLKIKINISRTGCPCSARKDSYQ
jgi:hypothetical protein